MSLLCIAAVGCVDHVDSTAGAADVDVGTELDSNECGAAGQPQMVVVSELQFVGATGQITQGLNLDGIVSDGSDEASCNQVDFEDSDGNQGIDNQFARLLPALESVAGGDSVQAVIQRTINSGGLLLTFEFARIDDAVNDHCVEVTVDRAKGQPTIGGDGFIEPSQTFDKDPNTTPTFVMDASLQDGILSAGPFDLSLPVVVDGFDVQILIRNAQLRGTFEEDSSMSGLIAGAISVPEVIASIENINASEDVLRLVSTALSNLADGGRDENGECTELSISLAFKATPAFFFEDSAP